MLVHPLLQPHFIDLDPDHREVIHLTNDPIRTYWGKVSYHVNDRKTLMPLSIGDALFSWDDLAWEGSLPTQLKKHLKGEGLHLFANIPFANTAKITGFNKTKIQFENTEPFRSLDDLPRHTRASYNARSNRRGLETLARIPLHWLSLRIIERSFDKLIQNNAFALFDSNSNDLEGSGEILGDGTIESFAIEFNRPPTIIFSNPTKLLYLNGMLRIGYEVPHAMTETGPVPAENLFDHPLFEKTMARIHNDENHNGIIEFSLDQEPQALADFRPDLLAEKLEEARLLEDRLLPDEIREWDAYLTHKDTERTTEPSEHVLTCHLHRSRFGQRRDYGGKNDAT